MVAPVLPDSLNFSGGFNQLQSNPNEYLKMATQFATGGLPGTTGNLALPDGLDPSAFLKMGDGGFEGLSMPAMPTAAFTTQGNENDPKLKDLSEKLKGMVESKDTDGIAKTLKEAVDNGTLTADQAKEAFGAALGEYASKGDGNAMAWLTAAAVRHGVISKDEGRELGGQIQKIANENGGGKINGAARDEFFKEVGYHIEGGKTRGQVKIEGFFKNFFGGIGDFFKGLLGFGGGGGGA